MSNEERDNAGAEHIVIIAPAANDRMFDHYEFLARVSEAAARKLLSRLLKDIRSLEFMPYRNPVFSRPYLNSEICPEIKAEYRIKFIVVGKENADVIIDSHHFYDCFDIVLTSIKLEGVPKNSFILHENEIVISQNKSNLSCVFTLLSSGYIPIICKTNIGLLRGFDIRLLSVSNNFSAISQINNPLEDVAHYF